MNSSTRHNDSLYDSMEPLHNSTLRPSSSKRRTTRNNQTMPTSRNQNQSATAMNNSDMVCICLKASPVMTNKMPSRSNDCNCSCHMDHMSNNMMEKDATFNMSGSSRRNKTSLQELEETMQNMTKDFDESILEVEDDPNNVTPLGRFYRVNSFR